MNSIWKRLAPVLMVLFALSLVDGAFLTSDADARSKAGGKSFSSSPSKSPASTPATPAAPAGGSSFGRGMMGGLLGGAIGGMLFGSMFGAGGSGMGILPLLLLGGLAFFLYRKFAKARQGDGHNAPSQYSAPSSPLSGAFGGATAPPPPVPPVIGGNLVADGINQIKEHDHGFDAAHFTEVASDVFFQVQAGWMRRDLDSYRHLLGDELAGEYQDHLAELKAQGHINKLESIAVREATIVQAGSDGGEDFVTVLFSANLLDYTVDDKSGELISGSMTMPVKFREEWTWARPAGTQNWKLEGIKES